MPTPTPATRTFRADFLTSKTLIVDQGLGSYVERAVRVESTTPLPAVGARCFFTTQSPAKTVTTGQLALKGEPSYAYSGYVLRCVDGDTLWLLLDLWKNAHFKINIRLLGVNCPEAHGKKTSPAGLEAWKYTESLLAPFTVPSVIAARGHKATLEVKLKKVDARLIGHDQKMEPHGRYLASIRLPSGEDLTQKIIENGHGHVYNGEFKVS